jgi:hypothetical protein
MKDAKLKMREDSVKSFKDESNVYKYINSIPYTPLSFRKDYYTLA